MSEIIREQGVQVIEVEYGEECVVLLQNFELRRRDFWGTRKARETFCARLRLNNAEFWKVQPSPL